MNAIRTTRNSRTMVSRGLSRKKFSAPGVKPAKPLRVAPACTENATLGYPAVSDSFRRRKGAPPHRSVRQSAVRSHPAGPARSSASAAKGSCNVYRAATQHACAGTFWRYAKMTVRERVSEFAHPDAELPTAPSCHSRCTPRHPARNLCECFPARNFRASRHSAAQILE
jgi:hypothetical protein